MDELIRKQDAIDAIDHYLDEVKNIPMGTAFKEGVKDGYCRIRSMVMLLPSAEPLTDAEQRIFLKAMGREEEVCKIVDEEYKDEGYKLNLVHACQEVIRKVKGALWT